MTELNTPPAPADEPASNPPTPEASEAPDASALAAEVAKWKSLSRKNETAFKAADKELAEFRQAAMSDQERAIEAARAEARTAALGEFGNQLVAAELRAQAASTGAALPDAEYLNLNRFLGDDGQPDSAAIAEFVTTLSATKQPAYLQNIGLGRQGASHAGQLTHTDISRMTSAQINEARSKGLLDSVMRGKL
ncbi:hypothetical protein ACIQ9Q_09485 [Streptomyces sp. NPDC094438]|uniref:hypothetical protein n=1 Tax=Streptomyces sp. NPDC094438 TaxID=3366061 RepID=UPI0038293A3A